MDIVEGKEGGVMTVALKGRLDALTSKGVEERLLQLIDAGERHMVMDLSQLDYISSVGLRVLILVAKRLKQLDGKVVVCALQEPIQQVFEISGFTHIFPIYATRAEAIGGSK
jgi:anti-anti-sigma factor